MKENVDKESEEKWKEDESTKPNRVRQDKLKRARGKMKKNVDVYLIYCAFQVLLSRELWRRLFKLQDETIKFPPKSFNY